MTAGRPRFRQGAGLAEWISIPLLLLIWHAAATILQDPTVPSPVAVVAELVAQVVDGRLLEDFAKTLARVAAAFAVSMLLGCAIGALLGRVRFADGLFAPWIVIGLNIPAIVVAIVCYIWMGLSEIALVTAVAINKTPLVATTMREGVRALSAEYRELAQVYRMSPWRRLRLVELPQLMPYLLTAARTGLSLIWKIVLVFEVLGSDGGVGFRIGIFFGFFDMTAILAYTLAFICVVFAVEYGAMRPLEQRILGWRPAQR
ncbi:ABC transporter permease protein [Oceanicola granulosus HTCC2516]|uniref:ABC transporter permease protein n=1 Tax=Oceanicola granulosus (strain ATCC BAA-861 / DSM 15982 / KCTC 12143 / HTCC2516) TaxID=314256 RepID=Q2CI89_OCEGH|nr:ABC transporter permease subunit [Oceanicola granulosus]EAR52369.1 ABC transporter permease protein [Oceanicola granulosus HTCC2516]